MLTRRTGYLRANVKRREEHKERRGDKVNRYECVEVNLLKSGIKTVTQSTLICILQEQMNHRLFTVVGDDSDWVSV